LKQQSLRLFEDGCGGCLNKEKKKKKNKMGSDMKSAPALKNILPE